MGAFADWMANKLQGRERLKAGAFDIPEDERDPLSLNSYWTPAEEAQAASDGGALDQAMAVAASPVTMAKGLWHGITNFLPSTERMMTRTPQSDAEIKQDALDAFGNVGMAALGAGPAGALTAQARRAALPGAFAHEIPFDLPPGPGRSIDMSTPAVHTGSTDLFDYGAMQGIAPDNPLKIPSHKYYEPPRGLNENAQALLADRKVSRGLSSAFDRGIRQSGEVPLDWYNMEPLRQRFGEMYQGPMSPDDAFLQFNDAIAASSVMNPVDQNMRNASQVYQLLQQGKQIPRSTAEMPTFAGPGGQTRLIVNRKLFGQEPGWDPFQSPKVDNFRRNLSGDQSTVTVDSHASRAPGMFSKDPRFLEGRVRTGDESGTGYTSFSPRELLESGQVSMKDLMEQPTWWQSRPRKSEYGAFAKLYERLADRKGVSPAQAQAAAWYGNADMTGVVTPPKTALQILEDVIKRNAERNGISDQTMLSDMINGRRALYANQARAGAPAIMSNVEGLQAREWVPSRGSGHMSGVQDMPFGDKLAMSRRSPFMAPDAVQSGPSFKGVGAYEGAGGLETNPVITTPYNALPEDVNAIGSYYAAMLGQDAVPTSWPGAVTGPNTTPARFVDVRTSDPLAISQMESLGKKPPGGAYAVIDDTTRGDVRFLGGEDMSTADIMARMREERIPASVSGEGIGASNYPDMAGAWAGEPSVPWDLSTHSSGAKIPAGYDVAWVDPAKVQGKLDPRADLPASREQLSAWAQSSDPFVSGPAQQMQQRQSRLMDFMRTKPRNDGRPSLAEMYASEAHPGTVDFVNGRNRFSIARDAGDPAVPVIATTGDIAKFNDMGIIGQKPPFQGRGEVTRKMLDAMDQATPATRGAFDNFEMRQRALAENMHNRAIAERYGLTTRADLMRMREIYGKEGFEGLRAALARGDALPSNADVAGIAAFLAQHEEGAEP